MTNSKALSILAASLRANLDAARLQLEHLSELYRHDGVSAHVESFRLAWADLRNAQSLVETGLELAGKEQAQKLHDSLPEHGREGAQRT